MFSLVVAVAVCGGGRWAVAAETLAEKCGKQFQNVVPCLSFATEKAATPSKECCDAVGTIKKTDPACLCFVIQQVHGGDNAQVKSMGVKEDRIRQLPAVCNIAGADITLCPKLLNLPANSPDAAIFTNSTAAPTTMTAKTPMGPGVGTSTPVGGGASDGFKHAPQLAGVPLLASAVLILGGLWAGFSFN
ncbi:unnamed protein product [Cuscuta campestris]|uniref:Bifunctional inhibitor/plant lipid transfer protein/seed storage helical domain-containing protein n=1 Tax=Cuscuta campestris TaxID=132261 RepID=A0A484LY81_9ASTE|nr:unnamed protein product [Cuscuta campestris]